jgi:oxygen-independent coproporphyrinogen-3 oxidase
LRPGAEVTVEANPESLDGTRTGVYRRAGVTRLSLGVQSLSDRVLELLGRPHRADSARRAVRLARAAGFHVSVDLIFGAPGQTIEDWRRDLEEAVALGPDHVSAYLLETEDHDTPLARDLAAGRLEAPDPDLAADQYLLARRILGRAGYRQYEISSFARPGHTCRHNLGYWSDRPFVGFGPSAASYLDGERRVNPRSLDRYLEAAREGRLGPEQVDPYDPERRLQEALFTGLRRLSGVSLRRLARRYGPDRVDRYRPVIERLERRRLLSRRGERLAVPPAALLLSNEVFRELV